MRIGIASDSPTAVEALRRTIADQSDHELAWIARNGAEAVEFCAKDVPDLVLMDLLMPVMSGVEATRRIMKDTPCAILVVTATVSGNTDAVFEAMGYGALDAADTPVLGEGGDALLAKINTIAKLLGKPAGIARPGRSEGKPAHGVTPPLVAIGSSTGGPSALAEILSGLPAHFSAAIVVVQHVDMRFAAGMAEWLGSRCPLRVRLIRVGDRPETNTVLLAETNDHLVLRPDLTLDYTSEPLKSPYRPSVDVFFESLAARWPTPGTAVILTGMGRDGAEGLLQLRRAGWRTIAQDEASSVVYGMPRAAVELKAAVQISPPAAIAATLAHCYSR